MKGSGWTTFFFRQSEPQTLFFFFVEAQKIQGLVGIGGMETALQCLDGVE